MIDTLKINKRLDQVTVVKEMQFVCELESGHCSVVLKLVDDEQSPIRRETLLAEGVVHMKIDEFGGGLVQLMCLRVESIGEKQLDRIRYLVQDLEDKKFSFMCERLSLE